MSIDNLKSTYYNSIEVKKLERQIKIVQSQEYKVFKHNSIIQNVVKRKNMLSSLEQKILNYIISQIKPNQKVTDNEFVFDMRLFSEICGADYDIGKNYINYKIALENLASNGFWLRDGQKKIYFQWIVTPIINFGTSKIIVTISDKVMPYLCDLATNFTSYELNQILKLNSSYSVAMYELLKSYEYQKLIKLSVTELKSLLGCEDKYKEYKDLRRNVIEIAINEINQKTNISVEWTPKRDGRNYTDIEFIIKEKDESILINGNL